MTGKPLAPADYRMSATDFDQMMRGALSAPPPTPPKRAPKKAKQPTAPKNPRPK